MTEQSENMMHINVDNTLRLKQNLKSAASLTARILKYNVFMTWHNYLRHLSVCSCKQQDLTIQIVFSSTRDERCILSIQRFGPLNISQHRVQSVISHPGIATHRNTIAPNPVSLHWSIPHCTYEHFRVRRFCKVHLST